MGSYDALACIEHLLDWSTRTGTSVRGSVEKFLDKIGMHHRPSLHNKVWQLCIFLVLEIYTYGAYVFVKNTITMSASCRYLIYCAMQSTRWGCLHCNDVTMSATASQITSVSIVYPTVCLGADQRKHQSSAWVAFVRRIHMWPVNSPLKGQVPRKLFHLMTSSMSILRRHLTSIGIPIIKIRPPHFRLIFVMEMPYLERPCWYWGALV